MGKIKKNLIFVVLAIAFFFIIKVDFNQTSAKLAILVPLTIIVLTQLYLFIKSKYKQK